MTPASLILLVIAGGAAVADWWAVAHRPAPAESVLKPLVLVALIGAALTLDPADSTQRSWFVVALVCSLAGDVFLLPSIDRFVPGLASFLLGHVAFIAGFALVADASPLAILPIVPIAVVATRVLREVRRRERDLVIPVVVYIAVIGAMVAIAVCSGEALAIVGAITFATSDSILAINRFEHERRRGPLAVMVTYHLAQALLVLSLV